jgi:hypothetical protein
MKKLIFSIFLASSVWSSFSFANNQNVYSFSIKQGATSITSSFTIEPRYYVAPAGVSPCLYFQEIGTLVFNSQNQTITDFNSTNPCLFNFGSNTNYSSRLDLLTNATTSEPTQTCKGLEGAFIDGFHNSLDDFCAIVGTTGGTNPEPLMCTATNISEIPAGSGNYQHTVTSQSCTAPTGPTAPDDGGTDPEPPCTENCEPTEPETPPATGNDGSDIPSTGGGSSSSTTTVTGTQTDSQGNTTNISMTMEQDYSPITTRQDETNQRLEAENQNSSSIIGQLAQLLEKVTGIGQGTAEISDKLDGVTDAINGIDTGTDTTAIEGKLDAINDTLGTSEQGDSLGQQVELPDVEAAINQGYDAINNAINSTANNEITNELESIGDKLTVFESIPAIFEVAHDSCSPIIFFKGSNQLTFNLCPYAAVSSSILSWVLTLLTVIFIIASLIDDIKRIRVT